MSYDDYQQPRQHARAYDNYYMNEEMGPEELNLNSTTTYTPGVGPGTYTPNDRLLTKTIPNVSVGTRTLRGYASPLPSMYVYMRAYAMNAEG